MKSNYSNKTHTIHIRFDLLAVIYISAFLVTLQFIPKICKITDYEWRNSPIKLEAQ